VSFTLATGEGAKVKPGHFLAVDDATDPDGCFGVYVTAVNATTDVVTTLMQYRGSPAVTANDLDGLVFEQNPLVPTFNIHKAVDDIFAANLYPALFKFEQRTVTPDLTNYQVDIPATVLAIDSAFQVIGGSATSIPFGAVRNTGVSDTGVLGQFGFIDGSTTHYTAIEKYAMGDETTYPELVGCVATGAAALCLGASISESALASSSSDSQSRGERDIGSSLWRDFLTLRQGLTEGLSRDRGNHLVIDRG
jgi:hypothetical protein